MAEEYNDGSISVNKNTTNSLTGLNNQPDLFNGPPVVADPAPLHYEGVAANPAPDRAPAKAHTDHAPLNPVAGTRFFSDTFLDDVSKGPRHGLGLTDR